MPDAGSAGKCVDSVAVDLCLQVLRDCCLHGSDLAAAICGCSADDAAGFSQLRTAFRVVLEDDDPGEDGGGAASSSAVTLQCLWDVLDSWDVAGRRSFVRFVTGTDR